MNEDKWFQPFVYTDEKSEGGYFEIWFHVLGEICSTWLTDLSTFNLNIKRWVITEAGNEGLIQLENVDHIRNISRWETRTQNVSSPVSVYRPWRCQLAILSAGKQWRWKHLKEGINFILWQVSNHLEFGILNKEANNSFIKSILIHSERNWHLNW